MSLRQKILLLLTAVLFTIPVFYIFWLRYGGRIELVSDKITRPVLQELHLHAETLAWLSTNGRFIVDEQEEKKILRGVNVSSINWGRDAWNSKAVDYAVKNWQAQVIRTRIFQDEFEEDPETFFAKMEREIIRPARKNGVYVILHPWIHSNQAMPDAGTVRMWTTIAERYKDDPVILYDLLAEPRDISRQDLRQAYLMMIESIRQVHPKSLIFVTGLEWGREINSWMENPLPYENIVYRSNPYNKPGEFEGLFGKIALQYPVFLGEFGADAYPPMSQQSVQALINYAEELDLGWTAWNFSASGCPCLLETEKNFLPSPYGRVIKEALKKYSQGKIVITEKRITFTDLTSPGTFKIYHDSLQNAFLDYSWGAEVDLVNRESVFSGEKSVKIGFTGEEASFYLNTSIPVPAKTYTNLSFWLKGEPDLSSLAIYLKDPADNLSPFLPLADYQVERQNEWTRVVVPLEDLEFTDRAVIGVFISKQYQTSTRQLFIDQIELQQ